MKKKILSLILMSMMIIMTVMCSKKNTDIGNPGNQPVEPDIKLSLMYPKNAENMVKMDDAQIKEKFQSAIFKLYPEQKRAVINKMSRSDFRNYVGRTIQEDPELKKITDEFRNNGIYFFVGSVEKKSTSRYGDDQHAAITVSNLNPVLKVFLEDTGLFESASSLLTEEFAKYVVAEDYKDIVFHITEPENKIKADGVGNVAGDDDMQNLSTIMHFWNPDQGWNAGNPNVWPILENALKSVVPNFDAFKDLLRPEYIVKLVETPPSAYYKALCLWYGWKELEWYHFGNMLTSEVAKIRDNFYPGVKDLASSNKALAIEYLAHVLHLLQDMSVPAHALNDPHGKFGGNDLWEGGIVRAYISKIVANETYRFTMNNGIIDKDSFYLYTKKYSSNNDIMRQELNRYDSSDTDCEKGRCSFYWMVNHYSQQFANKMGLWPLFYNTAQAAQFFPTYKVSFDGNSVVKDKNGNYYIPAADSASFFLNNAIGFKNNPDYNGEKVQQNGYVFYNNNGVSETKTGTWPEINFTILNLLTELRDKAQIEKNKSTLSQEERIEWTFIYLSLGDNISEQAILDFLIDLDQQDKDSSNNIRFIKKFNYLKNIWINKPGVGDICLINDEGYISGKIKTGSVMNDSSNANAKMESGEVGVILLPYPFNKMADYLVPLSVASCGRLLMNYQMFYNQ